MKKLEVSRNSKQSYSQQALEIALPKATQEVALSNLAMQTMRLVLRRSRYRDTDGED